jgi:hypothetical protein
MSLGCYGMQATLPCAGSDAGTVGGRPVPWLPSLRGGVWTPTSNICTRQEAMCLRRVVSRDIMRAERETPAGGGRCAVRVA